MKYAVIGSAFEGNKGAASMLEASIQTISARDKQAEFSHFSMYPRSDAKQNNYKNVTVLNAKPLKLGIVINGLSLLYALHFFRRQLIKNPEIAALAEADVVLDQGGITFVDGRGKFLIYNIASILPALLMRKRVIKCSQAMGPFNNRTNRIAAKLLLPRVNRIFARGNQTKKHLDVLKLNNVETVADYAFSLTFNKQDKKRIDGELKKMELRKTRLYILPSEVVKRKCDKLGIDYVAELADFVEKIPHDKFDVVLIPHSMRFSTEKRHNNDVPLVEELFNLTKKHKVKRFNKQVSAPEMRYLLSTADIIFTSRFHAMVSALASAVPVYVIGWSHKYQEVMDMFGIKDNAIDLRDLKAEQLLKEIKIMDKNRDGLSNKIQSKLDSVIASSQSQADYIVETAKK